MTRSYTTPAHDWRNYIEAIPGLVERLRGVVIEQRPAAEVLLTYDHEDALHYIDPPYPFSTRHQNGHYEGIYRHEMGGEEEHRHLADILHTLDGYVLISGYECALYEELYGDWQKATRQARADGAGERTEALWLSPRTWEALNEDYAGLPLFRELE